MQALAGALRGDGARWVVALLHDGVEWWPANPVATRSARLEDVARSWAGAVDLILGGHNFAAWAGALAGTPAGEPHVFGASVVVVDLADRAVVRGVCHRRAAPRRAARRHAGALGDGRPRQPRRRSRVVELGRMPAAASTGAGDPASVAMIPGVTQHLSLLLDRDVQASRPGSALATRWSRPSPERRRATA